MGLCRCWYSTCQNSVLGYCWEIFLKCVPIALRFSKVLSCMLEEANVGADQGTRYWTHNGAKVRVVKPIYSESPFKMWTYDIFLSTLLFVWTNFFHQYVRYFILLNLYLMQQHKNTCESYYQRRTFSRVCCFPQNIL